MNSFSGTDPAIAAQVQLFKAFLQQKVNLAQQIGLMKVRTSYYTSNSDFKIFKEAQAMLKLLSKRLLELRILNKTIKNEPITKTSSSLTDFFNTLQNLEPHLEVSRTIFSLNFSDETYIDSLKDHYEHLSSEFDQKMNQFKHNELVFEYDSTKLKHLSGLEQEIAFLQEQLEDLSYGKYKIEEKKQRKAIMRKSSFEAIKIYHRLSSEALKLRSKWLLRDEMSKNLEVVEQELALMKKKIESDEENLQFLQVESVRRAKELAKDQEELAEVRKRVERLARRIESLRDERERLVEDLISGYSVDAEEEYVEDETLKMESLDSGLEKLKRDKDELFLENQKLKERICKLGGLRNTLIN